MKKIHQILCAASGAIIVGFYDLGFNEQQSLVMKTGEVVRRYLIPNWDSSAWAGLVVVILIATYVSYVRNPKTKWAATEIGLGIIALLTTLMGPVKSEVIAKNDVLSFGPIAFAYAEESSANLLRNVIFELKADQPVQNIKIEVRDASTDKVISCDIVRSAATVHLKGLQQNKRYFLYIAGEGYRWTKYALGASGIAQQRLSVKIALSRVPMALQRFLGTVQPLSVDIHE